MNTQGITKDFYSAPELAKLLKVNPSTIKRWIDKDMLKAEKTPGGHRRVSTQNLAQFVSEQKKLTHSSYIISRLNQDKLIRKKLDWEDYYFFLYSNTSLSSKNLLEEQFLRGVPLLDIIENIILPVLLKVGVSWEAGRLSIYDEHRMTFLLRSDLLRLDRMLPPLSQKKSSTAVLACVEDENHEIPIFLLHLLLKQKGWRTIILGINTPAEEAAKAVVKNNAQLLCLAKSFSKIDEMAYLRKINKNLGQKKVKVALGGAGWKLKDFKFKGFKFYSTFRELSEAAKN